MTKKHNFVHWLAVVGIRLIKGGIFTGVGIYLMAVGLELSRTTLESFRLTNISYLPLSGASGGVMTWWTMVVGIPLMLLGSSLAIISFFNLWYAITSLKYNQAHCPWCNKITSEND